VVGGTARQLVVGLVVGPAHYVVLVGPGHGTVLSARGGTGLSAHGAWLSVDGTRLSGSLDLSVGPIY
jgi:hypothetical protein